MGISSWFNKSFTQKRYGLTTDGAGGFTQALSTIDSDVRGVMSRKGSSIRLLNGDEQNIYSHTFYCAAIEDIKIDDILEYGTQTWRILSIADPAQRGNHQECMAEEIQPVE